MLRPNSALTEWRCRGPQPPSLLGHTKFTVAGNGPTGTQACPPDEATLTGTIQMADVLGNAAAQGLEAGEFDEFLTAIRSGATYANVHSAGFPGGEIRGQVVETFR